MVLRITCVWRHILFFLQRFTEIETYVNHVEDQDRQIADLQQMGVLKDLKIADLEKELRATKDKAARMLINFDYEKHDIAQDAKVSAAITMYKIQLQMAAEAQDPSFDKSTWDVEGWKARLAELEDDEEAEEIPMLEGGDAGKDQGGEASGAGGDGAVWAAGLGCFGQKSHKDNVTKLYVNGVWCLVSYENKGSLLWWICKDTMIYTRKKPLINIWSPA